MNACQEPAAATYEATAEQLVELVKLGIADSNLSELRAACSRENLPADAWGIVVWAAIRLADFECNGKKAIKTGRAQMDSFIAVEKAALALRDAIQKLADDDVTRLDGCLHDSGIAPAANARTPSMKAVAAQQIASVVAASSRQALAKLDSEGVKGVGRKRTRCAYAGHIAALAQQLMPYNLIPGDNGPFRRLCDAVFLVAGVHANSQGAIKYFINNLRPAMRSGGLCL